VEVACCNWACVHERLLCAHAHDGGDEAALFIDVGNKPVSASYECLHVSSAFHSEPNFHSRTPENLQEYSFIKVDEQGNVVRRPAQSISG